MQTVLCVGPLLVDRCRELASGAVREAPGGNALIVACVAARRGLDAALHGQLGDDARGARLRAFLAGQGVRTAWLRTRPGPTKVACIDVDRRGQWSLREAVPHRFPYLQTADLPRLPAGFTHLHVAGANSLWRAAPEASRQLIRAARRAGMGLSVGCNKVGSERPALLAELDAQTLLFCNQEEAAALGAPEGLPCRRVLVSLGAEGAVLHGWGVQPLRMAAPRVEVRSTVGAGDILSAAFLAAWLRGAAPETALAGAVALASQSVQQVDWSGVLQDGGVAGARGAGTC